jgi:heavy metal translocating P-type ATPase
MPQTTKSDSDRGTTNWAATNWLVLWRRYQTTSIAIITLIAIALYLVLMVFPSIPESVKNVPLWLALILGGVPMVWELASKAFKGEFGADLLGGIAVVTSVILGEYLAGTIIVLMLSGGEALESYAMANAKGVLSALAKRMPSTAHRQRGGSLETIPLDAIIAGDELVVFPHEVCPVDGQVTEGHGVMDESYLTGEPFRITKTVGSEVISGAINGDTVLTIQATRPAADSRYAKIMDVMRESEQKRPTMRRLGDQIGTWFTPLALAIAGLAWWWSGDSIRFLSVLVIATPCPLLLAIPIAILGSISLCARRAIIVKSPVALEQVVQCRTAIFDKTGTLTYGEPTLTEQVVAPEFSRQRVLQLVASLERYSKHPLAHAIMVAAEQEGIQLLQATQVNEAPGMGLSGMVDGQSIRVTSRRKIDPSKVKGLDQLPSAAEGLECIIIIDENYAAAYRMHDAPRADSRAFVEHLAQYHGIQRVMIVSGDRESEVRYLADQVGISEVLAQKSPEEKLSIVQDATRKTKTLYVGDGINDAPAMMAATVGIAIGGTSDVTAEAADVVVMENTLKRVDEFLHIGRRMRTIALQSALGGMALSIIGMCLAAMGWLTPVGGAVAQEVIDVLAVLNALRAAWPPPIMSHI